MELVLTAKVKLLPTDEQKNQLLSTLRAVRDALNYASAVAFEHHQLSSFKKLQTLVYADLRERYGMKSQMACNVCSVVAGTYTSMKANGERTLAVYKKPKFQYSFNRDYSFTKDGLVSVGTLEGRMKIPFVTKGIDSYFDGSWTYGTATLVTKKGKFYLHISVKKEEADIDETNIKNVVGVDVGMNFLATAMNAKDRMLFVEGRHVKNKKAQYKRIRKQLQQRQTPSARRRLKKIGNRENRFQTDLNHKVSKALVRFAGENSLIALEDLTGIRSATVQVKRQNRYYSVSWAFYQLRFFIEYKAKLAGIKVVAFDPKYTSQKCPKCGHTEKANRDKKTHTFSCRTCCYTSNDDRIGAMNLRAKGIEYLHNVSVGA